MQSTQTRFTNPTTRWCAVLLVAVAVLPIALPIPAYAGQYVLEKGKGVEVCEAYGKNLNSLNYSYPMACEREVNPGMKELKEPDWKEISILENRTLILGLQKFLEPHNSTIDGSPEYWASLESRINNRHVSLHTAIVDIDNDGAPENILKYQDGACQMAHRYATPILVADTTGKALDRSKSLPLLQNDSPDKESNPAGGWGYAMYDVFLFKGTSYFDKWSDFHTEKGFLHVFKTNKNQASEVCTYKYVS